MIKKALRQFIFMLMFAALLLAGCASVAASASRQEVTEITYADWEGVMPQSILDDFAAETGVKVNYVSYQSQEDVIAEIKSGKVYDVLVLENQFIPPLAARGMLLELNYKNIPNFNNISANFRDLTYDPGNRHSVPYSWGMTGLIYADDKVSQPIIRWADLWNLQPAEKIVGWNLPRYMIGMTLKSLGYSINSANPQELEAALARLIELKPHLVTLDWEPAVTTTKIIADQSVVAGIGESDDIRAARTRNAKLTYVLPAEGAILWGDSYTIPFTSSKKEAAEKFINFLLRADVAAKLIAENGYWLPNDAAMPLLDADLRSDTAIFPPQQDIQNAEILLALDAAGEKLYADIWQRFLDAQP
jgi:spermidine/putrescine transport system substrate-binding protein